MGFNVDDIFSEFTSGTSSKKSAYTVEEIEAAKKRQKKLGGTFLENLEAIAPGKKAPAGSMGGFDFSGFPSNGTANSTMKTPSGQSAVDAATSLEAMSKAIADIAAKSTATVNSTPDTLASLTSNIKEMNESLYADFGVKQPEPVVEENNENALKQFAGLSDVLKEKIYGQDEFIKKLIIAFKRPFVTERDKNDALNSIYITGPSCTGKHYALQALVYELSKRRVVKTNDIYTLDLSSYPTATEEKLFLQDLYSALQSNSSVILFENFDSCHVSMLTRLAELVSTGEFKLADRYVSQNGQLVNVANALAGKTVGSFEASGKYLIFISSKSVEKLAGVMGAPFINALGDVCATSELDAEALGKIAAECDTKLVEKSKKQLSFNLTLSDSFKAHALTQNDRGRGLKGILDFYADTLRALSELRLERDDLASNDITLDYIENNVEILCGEEKISMYSLLPGSYNGELDAVKAEMESIVGLKAVKEYIYSLEEYFAVQKKRRESGLKAGEVNKHMIFTGNPGTGKTTIARIVSKYLKAIGVLSGGQLVEVSRADLVGRYVGHTAPLVNQVIKSALGGVLFIDEAYSLHRGGEDSFGLEAIDTLVKGIEDNRDDLIVILAGYSNEMAEFLESNSGLKSRFPNIIDFPDYTAEELFAIAKLTAKSKGYVIDPSCEEPMLAYFEVVQATRAMDAGNGRLVRNKLEEAILNQSRRLVAEPDADMSLLLPIDFVLED